MEDITRTRIYIESTRMNIHDIVRELNENLGVSVVQGIAAVKNRTSPSQWAKPDGPEPRPEVETRLRLGHRVWKTLELSEGNNVALAWLLGANPRLNEDVPLLYIQRNQASQVIGAAEAFISDNYAA
ncbi:hypothetical protein [Glutamicibacter ardleyensis]|uniref:hypothetical protein n=1 Tax=Glutamicibacter ardleyensis TaxID=225894 RepID=UPI003FD2DC26